MQNSLFMRKSLEEIHVDAVIHRSWAFCELKHREFKQFLLSIA